MRSDITVLVVDDHPLFRMGLAMALHREGFLVIEHDRGDRIDQVVGDREFDVAVLDVRLPGVDGIDLARALLEKRPQLKVVMLSTFDLPAIVARARDAGAVAFYPKEIDPIVLGSRIRRLVAGESAKTGFERAESWRLTQREWDVLVRVVGGETNRSIAESLGIGPDTVKDHVTSLMRKLDVNDRVGLTRKSILLGLIDSAVRGNTPP